MPGIVFGIFHQAFNGFADPTQEALFGRFWKGAPSEFHRLKNVLAAVFALSEYLSEVSAELDRALGCVIDDAKRGDEGFGLKEGCVSWPILDRKVQEGWEDTSTL